MKNILLDTDSIYGCVYSTISKR